MLGSIVVDKSGKTSIYTLHMMEVEKGSDFVSLQSLKITKENGYSRYLKHL